MQSLYKKEEEKQSPLAGVLAGVLTAITLPFLMIWISLVGSLILYAGISLLYPWLVQLVPEVPQLGFLHAWGLILIMTGIEFASRAGRRRG